jgi:amidophosphoribosyltransferase
METHLYLEIQQELDQHYYQDDEIVVVASERPVIQTVLSLEEVHEIDPGKALIIKKNGSVSMKFFLQPLKKACSFERIYFSRGSDAEIYQERKN